MSPDIREALEGAAARPNRALNADRVAARAKQIGRRRQIASGALVALALVSTTAVVVRENTRTDRRLGLTSGTYYPGTETQLARDGVLHLPPSGHAEAALLDDGTRVFVTHRENGNYDVVGAGRNGPDWLAVEVGACADGRGFVDPITDTTWGESGGYRSGTEMPDLTIYRTELVGSDRARVLEPFERVSQQVTTGPPVACADLVYPDAPVPAAPAGTYGEAARDGWAFYDGLIASVSGRWHLCGVRDSQPAAATALLTGCPGGLRLPEHEPHPPNVDAIRGRFVGLSSGGVITRLLILPGSAAVPKPADTQFFGYVTGFDKTASGGLVAVVDKADWFSGNAAVTQARADGIPADDPRLTADPPIYVRNVNALLRSLEFRDDADVWLTSTSQLLTNDDRTTRRLTPSQLRDRFNLAGGGNTLGFWFALDAPADQGGRILWAVEQFVPVAG